MKLSIRYGVVALFVATAAAGSALGEPGEGIQAGGDVLVRPFADVSVGYDNNPLLLSKGQELDDFFMDVIPGLNVTRVGEYLRLEGLFWGRFRRFDKYTSQNKDDWSEELRLGLGRREDWHLQLHEGFMRLADYDISINTANATGDRYLESPAATYVSVMERSLRVDRYILDAGAGAGGPLTDKMSLETVVDYGEINYQAPNLLDSTEMKASVKAARKVTDKSSAILVGDYILMDNASLSKPANYYAGRAGWRWQGTVKSRFEGTVGYYAFTDDQGSVSALDHDGFSYDVAWHWQALPKLAVTLDGRSEMQLAADTPQNAKQVDMLTGIAQYSVTKRLAFALLAGYRHENFILEQELVGNELGTRVVEQLHIGLRCDYQLLKWLKAYGDVWHEDTQDNVQGNYLETRATLGMRVEY